MSQFSSTPKNFLEQQNTSLYLPSSPYQDIITPRAQLDALVLTYIGFLRLYIYSIGAKRKSYLSLLNTTYYSSPQYNPFSFFIISISSTIILEYLQINFLQKLANPRKDYTSLTMLGVSQSYIVQIFLGSILTPLLEIIKPRNLVLYV